MGEASGAADATLSTPSRELRPSARGVKATAGRTGKTLHGVTRKEQNRIASQRYREKRKQKLDLLDEILKPGGPEELPLAHHNNVLNSQIAIQSYGNLHCSIGSDHHYQPPHSSSGRVDLNATPYTALSSLEGGDLELNVRIGSEIFDQTSASHLSDLSAFGGIQELPLGPAGYPVPNTSLGASTSLPTLTPDLPLAPPLTGCAAELPTQQQSSLDTGNQWSGQWPQDNLSTALKSLQYLSLSQKRQVMCLLRLETLQYAARDRDRSSTRSSSTSDGPSFDVLIGIKREVREYESWLKANMATTLSLGDPKYNTIRLVHSSFYAAVLANSTAIGLSNCELLQEEGLSPFSLRCTTERSPEQIQDAQARYAARVPPGLAPCAAQVAHVHHPYLDVLPFQEFRKRAMAALQCDPPLYDEDEMCHDLDAEGLVCWGGGLADGESDGARRAMECEVPWDPRSWEPKAWFLEKYWFLVGGRDGEMHASARLWAKRRLENMADRD